MEGIEYMQFVGCMLIGIVLSYFVSMVMRTICGNKITIKSKYKYYLVNFGISVIVGLLVFSFFDYDNNMVYAGFFWGLIDGFLQTFVSYEN